MDSATSDVDSVAEVSEVEEDLKELKLFLGQAQRPRVKELLQGDIQKLETEASAAAAVAAASNAQKTSVVHEETVEAAPQQKKLPTKNLDTYGGPAPMDSDDMIGDAASIVQDSEDAVQSDHSYKLEIVNIIKSENSRNQTQIENDGIKLKANVKWNGSDSDEDIQDTACDSVKEKELENLASVENLNKMISDVISNLNVDEIGLASGDTEIPTSYVTKLSDESNGEVEVTLMEKNRVADSDLDCDWEPEKTQTEKAKTVETDSDPEWQPENEKPKAKRAKTSVESPVKSTKVVATPATLVVKPGTTVKSTAPANPWISVNPGWKPTKKICPPDPKEKEFQATITLKSGEKIVVAVQEKNRQALLKHSAIVCACMQQYIADHGLPKHGEKPLFLNLDSLGKPLGKGAQVSNLIGFGRGSIEKRQTVVKQLNEKPSACNVHGYQHKPLPQPTCKLGRPVQNPEQRPAMPVGVIVVSSNVPTTTESSASSTSGLSQCSVLNPHAYRWSETETRKLLALYRTYKEDIQEFNGNAKKAIFFNPWLKITEELNKIPGAEKSCKQVREKICWMRKSFYKTCVARDERRRSGKQQLEPSLELKELYSLFKRELRHRKLGYIKDFHALHEELTNGYTPPATDPPVKVEVVENLGASSPTQNSPDKNTNTRTTPVVDADHDYSWPPSPRKRRKRPQSDRALEFETIKHVQEMMVQSDQRLNDTLLQLHSENKRIMEKLIARL